MLLRRFFFLQLSVVIVTPPRSQSHTRFQNGDQILTSQQP